MNTTGESARRGVAPCGTASRVSAENGLVSRADRSSGRSSRVPFLQGGQRRGFYLRPLAVVVWLLYFAFLTAGCGDPEVERSEQGVTATRPPHETVAEADERLSPETTERGTTFSSPSTREGGTPGAADRIRTVRFEDRVGYERAIIGFGRRGEVAQEVPTWTLSGPAEGGYVRLSFPGISSTATASSDFVGLVMDEFYVVRDPEGGLFVDIFAIRPFRYRVLEFSDRGLLAVDYRAAAGGLPRPVVRGEKTVVLQPREAEQVRSPIRVSGYSRNFEAMNVVRLEGRDGEVLASKTVVGNDWTQAWGYFETSLRVARYEGLAVLRVGQENPRTGAFEGVKVPVEVEKS